MPPRSEKEDMLNALSRRIFSAMLDDLILDAALQAHHEVLKGKAVCKICHTRCGSSHLPGSLSQATGTAGATAGPSSRADTPSSAVSASGETGKGAGSGSVNGGNGGNGSVNGGGTPNAAGTGAGTPTSGKDGTVLLDCVVCQRPMASNRYAQHLASCMGLSSARRGPTRASSSASGKPKLPSDAGRSASPASETGNGSDERFNGKGKGKAKPKRPGTEESEGSLKRKRPQSPQTSPAKVNKKAKASGSPVSRVRAEPDSTGPLASHYASSTGTVSKSKVPSKLRESSTTSFLDRSPSSASSRSSSPAATPASSAFSAATQSPSIGARVIGSSQGHGSNGVGGAGAGRGRGKATGTGPPARRVVSPPRPPPPPSIVHHVAIVPDYGIHDGGDETGSSTDTDSD